MTDREWEPCQLCNGAGKVGHRYDDTDFDWCNGCDGQGGRWLPVQEEAQE